MEREREARGEAEDAPFPADEGRSFSSDVIELIEMANLSTAQTGMPGTIYISTAQGNHGPRVTWYPDRPGPNAPCFSAAIEAEPKAFNHRLPKRVFDAAIDPVSAWVVLNRARLLDFWNHGNTWMDDEVTAFKQSLARFG